MTRFRHVSLRRPTGRAIALPFVAFAVLATFACSLDKLTSPKPGTGPTIDAAVTGDSLVPLGGTIPMTVTTTAGAISNNSAVILYSTSDPTVATVDQTTGVVTGVKLGTAHISAAVIAPEIGEVGATDKVVRVKYAGIKITAIDSLIAIGMTKVIDVKGTNAAGVAQASIPFSSTTMQVVSRDPTIYDVNSSGALVAKVNGTARLFVQFDNLKDSVNVKVRQVARSITFPTAVSNELAIQSLNKDRTLQVTPRDSLGVAITGSTVTWSTSDATTVTVGAATGLARGLKLGTARVRATVDGKIDSVLARVTQVAGIINKLAGDAQSVTVGSAVTTIPMVAVLDSGNTPVPNAAVTFAVASGGGSLTGATPTASASGQASVGSWTLGTAAGANTLTASSDGASATFTATGTPGAATKLIFTTQPSNSPSGSPLTTFRVGVADANDNVVTTATNSITVSLGTGPGAIGGTQTVVAVAGVATFSAVTLSATGSYTISAAATGLTSVTSNSFGVFGPATKLGFTTQPVGNTATIPMATFRVAVQDVNGNTVTSGAASTSTVTLTLNTGSFTAASTVSTAAVAGVATFSNVSAATAGTFTIGATAPGLTAATSTSFTIASVGPAAKLTFSVQPVNGTAGTALADIKVRVEDANGVLTASTASVTLGIETNVGNSTISGGNATVGAVAGVATFSGIVLNKSGTGYKLNATSTGLTKGVSNTFNLVAGAAFKLGFAAAVPNAVVATAISPAVQVQVQDANGNVVPTATNSITVTSAGGTGTLSGGAATPAVAGVASFSALSLSAAGTTYTLAAQATGLQTGTSTTFSVVTSTSPIKLAFITQPTNVNAGTVFSPSVEVAVQDVNGNTVSSTASVTLGIATGPTGASITNFTKSAVAGVAKFDLSTIPLAGNGYSLNATSTGLTSATSNTFNVSPGAPAKLVWLTSPQTTTAGVAFANDLQVQILDGSNNLVPTATNTVTLTYGTFGGVGQGGGNTTPRGTLSVAAIGGIATFPGIRITRIGTGYTLFAQSTNLSSANSTAFDVTVGPPVGLSFVRAPSGVVAGAQQASPVQVNIADSLGNTVSTSSSNITLSLTQSPVGGTMSGTPTQATASGVATFADIVFPKSGSYTVTATATAPELATVTSSSFFISAAAASKLAFVLQPTNTFVNAPMNPGTNQVQVQVQDAFGNQVTSNATIAIAVGNNPGGATLTGTLSGPASFGTYFIPTDVKLNKAGVGYTLTASTTGLTSATSTAFNVDAFTTAQQMIWIQQPMDNVTDAVFRLPPSVAIADQYGNVVTNAPAQTVQFYCTSACGTITNFTALTSSGVATFSTMTISAAGTYQSGAFINGGVGTSVNSASYVIGANTAATSAIASTGVYDVAVNSGVAYYIERAAGTGAIKSVNLTTGATATLASSLNNPAAILSDGTNVYWIEDGTGLVKRVPVGGGTIVTMSTVMTGMQQTLQTDGTFLFFATNNQGGAVDGLTANTQRQIQRIAKNASAGTLPTAWYTLGCGLVATCVPTFSITGTTLYFWRTQDNSISSTPTTSTTTTTLATGVTSAPSALTFGGGTIYYVLSGQLYSGNGVSRGAVAGGSLLLAYDNGGLYLQNQAVNLIQKYDVAANNFVPITLTSTTAGANTRAMAFDANFLFWADNSNPTKLRRVAK